MAVVASVIAVRRKLSHGRDRHRRYTVLIDNAVVGRLASGDEKEYPVSAGEHRVRLRIDRFFTSPERVVLLQEGERVQLVSQEGGSWLSGLLILVRPRKYIALETLE